MESLYTRIIIPLRRPPCDPSPAPRMPPNGGFKKNEGYQFGVRILRILIFGSRLGSPFSGNHHMNMRKISSAGDVIVEIVFEVAAVAILCGAPSNIHVQSLS